MEGKETKGEGEREGIEQLDWARFNVPPNTLAWDGFYRSNDLTNSVKALNE